MIAVEVFKLCLMPMMPGMGEVIMHDISATELRNAMYLCGVKRKMHKDTILRVKEMEFETRVVFDIQVERAKKK